jgi:hypothetical protein
MLPSAQKLVLVSDDALLARSVQVASLSLCSLVVANTIAQAHKILTESQARAVIIDGALFGPRADEQLAKLRRAAPLAAFMYVAPQLDLSLINALQCQRVQLLVRPLPPSALAQFVERAFSAGIVSRSAVKQWIAHLAVEMRLSRADLHLMPFVLGEEDEAAACLRLDMDRATLERGLRRLIKKCRVRNLDRLARNIMRDAYLIGSDITAELIEPPQAASF